MELIKSLQNFPKIEKPHWRFPKSPSQYFTFPKLQIGDLTSDIPIIQGGMGVCISLSGLASTVSREGAIGVIAANAIGMLEQDFYRNGKEANIRALKKELRKAREKSNGIIGVNIMVAGNDFHSLLNVCIEEKVQIVFLGAGLPIKTIPVKELRTAKVKIIPIVSSHRAADVIFRYWLKNYKDIPDGVVVEGPKAGGHLGFKINQIDHPDYQLEKIVLKVIETISVFEKLTGNTIPVIAAGGIYNGEDIYRFMKMGVKGVQMGTRFVATHECDADKKFKEQYIKCKREDIIIIKSPVGMPGRAIKSTFFDKIKTDKREFSKCPWNCLKQCDAQNARYCIAIALNHARKGNLQKGFAFSGSNAHRINSIISVKELLDSLKAEFQYAMQGNIFHLRQKYEKSLEKLSYFKNEYAKVAEKALILMKKQYENIKIKGSEYLKHEYDELVSKISILKSEYLEYTNQLRTIFNQLSTIRLG